jgi:hypothetical protein
MFLKRGTIVLVLLVLLAGMAAASASAVKADTVKKPGSDLVFQPVSPTGVSPSGMVSPMTVSDTITQGQTKWYSKYIPPNCPGFYVDLNWGNPSNSLRLRVYAPDGRVYGPFYDSSDGRTDGRILFWVSSGSGSVPSGTYYYEVYGDRVNGVQRFTI